MALCTTTSSPHTRTSTHRTCTEVNPVGAPLTERRSAVAAQAAGRSANEHASVSVSVSGQSAAFQRRLVLQVTVCGCMTVAAAAAAACSSSSAGLQFATGRASACMIARVALMLHMIVITIAASEGLTGQLLACCWTAPGVAISCTGLLLVMRCVLQRQKKNTGVAASRSSSIISRQQQLLCGARTAAASGHVVHQVHHALMLLLPLLLAIPRQ